MGKEAKLTVLGLNYEVVGKRIIISATEAKREKAISRIRDFMIEVNQKKASTKAVEKLVGSA